MGILLTLFLPLSLAIIMFSLGLGLTIADFKRVLTEPKAFTVGALSQVLILPVIALGVATLFNLPGELAVGLMILSFSPGGVTTNILTKLAKGDVALSVTLTGVISLLSMVTVPLLVVWSMAHFMGSSAPEVNISRLAISMFAITAVPVLLGVLIRHFASGFAIRSEPVFSKIATVLFVVIVIAALAVNWDLFVASLPTLGPAVITLNIVLLIIGWLLARGAALSSSQAKTIAIETGIQNSTLGITVGSLIAEQASGLPPFSLPSALYGILMYGVSIPVIMWMRTRD